MLLVNEKVKSIFHASTPLSLQAHRYFGLHNKLEIEELEIPILKL
jgi:hypothetical protein